MALPHASVLNAAAPSQTGGRRATWMLVAALTFAYLLNHADRNVFVVAAPLIQGEFGLSDMQLGLLTGAAFALMYSLCGVPLGYIADRTSRRTMLTLALIAWSLLTATMGLAASAMQLAVLRILVGIGESGCAPASHSLLGQHMQGGQRSMALAIFGLGSPLGIALAFAGGGYIAEQYGWRMAFLVLGLLGLPVAVWVWFAIGRYFDIREPAAVATESRVAASETLRGQILQLLRRPAFTALLFANGFLFLACAAVLQWAAVYLHRAYDMPLSRIGLWLALATGITPIVGNLLGGFISIRNRLDDSARLMRVSLLASACGLPLVVSTFVVANPYVAIALLGAGLVFVAVTTGPNYSAAQELAGSGLRATGAALVLLVANILGLGLGTPIVGALSDAFSATYGPIDGLRYSVVLVAAIASGVAIGLFMYAIRLAGRSSAAGRE